MIQSQRVVHFEAMGDAPSPPLVSVLFHRGKVEEAVAPDLSLCGERIGRDSRDGFGMPLLVEEELLPVRPDVHALGGDIERQVADDVDAARVDPALQKVPLPVKLVLLEGVELYLAGEFPSRLGERLLLAESEPVLPFGPVAAEAVRERHKERIVGEPVALLLFKFRDLLPDLGRQTFKSDV